MSNKTKRPNITRAVLARVLNTWVNNQVQSRLKFLAGEMDGDSGLDPIGRNLDAECGYPLNPTVRTFRRLYDREGYAARVVNLWPDECFASRPYLYETEDSRVTKWERAVKKVMKKVDLWHYLHRLDRAAGIGTFGVLLLGFNDGKKLKEPAPGFGRNKKLSSRPTRKTELIYCQVYAEDSVRIAEVDKDVNSPRFKQPLYYEITVASPEFEDYQSSELVKVHWSRIVHFADNCESNNVRGTPRMRPNLNRLLDIRKILGSSGEMFWKGGFPGYALTTQENTDGSQVDVDSVKDQVEAMLNGLQRWMAFDGMNVTSLLPQAIDPTNHVMQQVAAICATMGCPISVFLGREAGHLASMENTAQWNKRVGSRQELTLEPYLIRPTVQRLIDVNVLPEPGDGEFLVAFKDLNTLGDKEKADVSLKKAQALMQYVSGGVESVFPVREFLTMVIGLTDKEAAAVIKAREVNKGKEVTDPLDERAKEKDAEMKIKVAKATPAKTPVAGTGGRTVRKVRPQGGGRRGASSGGRPRGVVSRS